MLPKYPVIREIGVSHVIQIVTEVWTLDAAGQALSQTDEHTPCFSLMYYYVGHV